MPKPDFRRPLEPCADCGRIPSLCSCDAPLPPDACPPDCPECAVLGREVLTVEDAVARMRQAQEAREQ